MTVKPDTSPRTRLLDAAAELFYRDGVGIGVEALCRAAGVSKRSMYQLFDGKDAVLAASLERKTADYLTLLLPPEDDPRPPRDRALHVFEQLERLSGSPEYKGCPFVATAFELKDPDHPASAVARAGKDRLTAFFRTEAERGGAPDPETAARRLTFLYDGAMAHTVVQAQALNGSAVAAARALLDQTGLA